ncbi:MAG: HAMP domain-containing protein [Clostridia bacterium]|nr:HAMP domain-containing protein [Clostridia bacterium]
MLKKSIFGQMFAFTVLVFLICFFVIGTIMYGFLGDYLTKKNEGELNYIAERLSEMTMEGKNDTSGLFHKLYQINLNAISDSTGTFIIVMDENGQTLVNSGDGISVRVRSEFSKSVLTGKTEKYIGTLGGVFNRTMLTVARPIRSEGNVVGAVFVNLPIPEIHRIRSDVVKIFILSACFVIIVALVFIYILSRRLTKPIKAINYAAKSIASGDFARRVDIRAENEIGELGETFNQMADSLEQLEHVRRSFIANVSHELRTPMTTITGFVEGIMDGTIPPEMQKQYLSIVLDESKRLSRLVTDLLDLSKMEQGEFPLEMREFDINEMIRLNIIKAEKRIMEKDIQLTVSFQRDSQRVLADKDSIQRVLTNLMDNAIKFTQNGGFLDIRTGVANGKTYVAIQNSGMGIAKNELTHVFDRFYKTDKSRSQDKSGAGLGLYIVKNIIQAHGETIWAESEPGEFARFNFTLKSAKNEGKQVK